MDNKDLTSCKDSDSAIKPKSIKKSRSLSKKKKRSSKSKSGDIPKDTTVVVNNDLITVLNKQQDQIDTIIDQMAEFRKELSIIKRMLARRQLKVNNIEEQKLNYFVNGQGASVDHITMDEIISYIKFKNNALEFLLKDKYFDKRCPENHIIKVLNKTEIDDTLDNTEIIQCQVYDNDTWNPIDNTELISILVDIESEYLYNKTVEVGNVMEFYLSKDELNSILKYFKDLPSRKKELQQKILEKLLMYYTELNISNV